jgi:hypothetical protein
MQEDCATKTSTNVNFHPHPVEMVQHAKTPMDLINACVPKDMKEEIAQSTPMTALHSLVKTVEHAWMELEITRACATTALMENTVKSISTNAFLHHAKTVQHAINM